MIELTRTKKICVVLSLSIFTTIFSAPFPATFMLQRTVSESQWLRESSNSNFNENCVLQVLNSIFFCFLYSATVILLTSLAIV